MKCWKCGKELNREDGKGTMEECAIDVSLDWMESDRKKEIVDYSDLQLGKYSNGQGKRYVAICYECFRERLLYVYAEKNKIAK